MEDTAPQERIRQLLLGVARDHHHRTVLRRDRLVELGDVEAHDVELVQQIVGELDVCLVDLVDEQHDALVLEAVTAVDADTVILFAQFSMERILLRSAAARSLPVLGPASEAVRRLRELLGRQ